MIELNSLVLTQGKKLIQMGLNFSSIEQKAPSISTKFEMLTIENAEHTLRRQIPVVRNA